MAFGLIAEARRNILPGREYDRYFPPARGTSKVIFKADSVVPIIPAIARIAREKSYQTEKIAQVLKRSGLRETLKNIWQFVYDHINYDTEDDELLREPARTWADRSAGVDCDCYTIFISSILHNLGINHSYRITAYKNRNFYQHIYIIVENDNKTYVLDCVKDAFNQEEPYTSKMDQFITVKQLSGIMYTENPFPAAVQKRFQGFAGDTPTPGSATPPATTTPPATAPSTSATPPATAPNAQNQNWFKKNWMWLAGGGLLLGFIIWKANQDSGKSKKGLSGTDKPKKPPVNYRQEYTKLTEKIEKDKAKAKHNAEIEDLKKKNSALLSKMRTLSGTDKKGKKPSVRV